MVDDMKDDDEEEGKLGEMKFYIGDNPKLCAWVQKRLFALGYRWGGEGTLPYKLDSCFLYASCDGRITMGNTELSDHEHFAKHSYEEIDLLDLRIEGMSTGIEDITDEDDEFYY